MMIVEDIEIGIEEAMKSDDDKKKYYAKIVSCQRMERVVLF